MSNHAQRRAAARFAAKQSAKSASVETAKSMTAAPRSAFSFDQPASSCAETSSVADAAAAATRPISEAQLAANRANTQLSTGAKTPEGKHISSHNALKSGLTGQTILLPTDDFAAYQRLAAHMTSQYRPLGCEEEGLVQSLIDTEWRLRRIPRALAGGKRKSHARKGRGRGAGRFCGRGLGGSGGGGHRNWLRIFESRRP